jgi:hypothetical protein
MEFERLVKLKHLESFGINPHAAMLVFEAYAKNCHPLPVRYVWGLPKKDKIMDNRAESRDVEIVISTAGYLGNKWASPKDCDLVALKLLAISYYRDLRPQPVIFQMANAVTFSLTTPGESGKKNPLRHIKGFSHKD